MEPCAYVRRVAVGGPEGSGAMIALRCGRWQHDVDPTDDPRASTRGGHRTELAPGVVVYFPTEPVPDV